jgi:hypothetical protein
LQHTSIQAQFVNRKFKNVEYSLLFDQLAHQTAIYTRLLTENGSAQKKGECRQLIHRLLAEINIRERERGTSDPADRVIS